MVELSLLPKIINKKKRRLGQGYGSGRGKTAGRGTKGQKARETIPVAIKMAGTSFVKRLPLFRGKGRQKRISNKPLIVNLKDLNNLAKNTVVDLELLVNKRLVKKDQALIYGVKLLGDGEIKTPLIVKISLSNNARKKIEMAGGKVGE